MKKVLLVGSSGYIGNLLLNGLQGDFHVIGLSRSHKHDDLFMNTHKLKAKLSEISPDIIIYLINAPPSVSEERILEAYQTNNQLLKNFLSAMKDHKPWFIYVSSSAVYGLNKDSVVSETSKRQPVNLYGLFKCYSEDILFAFAKEHGVPFTILRVFNIYGPKNMIFQKIFESIKNNNMMHFHGLHQKRDYLSEKKFLHVLSSLIDRSLFKNEVLNVGSGNAVQIRQVLDTALEVYPAFSHSIVEHEGRYFDSVADISKLKSQISLEPEDILDTFRSDLKSVIA
ncbi:NAD(P)-dependent oxidoreductase [Candidatus Woesearchaeota archaeon]|nr:MAG: NAD(P)-dependent oxidoreductase [Candidatus Woesearchaeota archaeon]